MKRGHKHLVVFLVIWGIPPLMVIGAAVAGTLSRPMLGESRPCRIVEVYDGDTVVVEFLPQRARVRLIDCWAAEVRTKDEAEKARGLKAREHLKSIAEGKAGTVFVPYHENVGESTTLGRLLGHVWVDGDDKSLSEYQVEAGHATKEKPK